MAEKDVNLKQVLKRFHPGDRWTPADADQQVFANLTKGIEYITLIKSRLELSKSW